MLNSLESKLVDMIARTSTLEALKDRDLMAFTIGVSQTAYCSVFPGERADFRKVLHELNIECVLRTEAALNTMRQTASQSHTLSNAINDLDDEQFEQWLKDEKERCEHLA